MKLQRTKNTIRNIIWGVMYQIMNTVLPFISRTIFIYILGEQYLGLNSIFTSILSVLNISELGVSSAIVYSMYGAIARDDHNEICALMNFYKKCYRVIGTVILMLGSLMFPFLSKFVSGDIPADVNIYVLYGINLFSTVISYFLYAYKHSMFWAFQRGDLNKKVIITMSTLQYLTQIVLLMLFKSYYAYVIITPIYNMIINIILGHVADKNFPMYRARGELSRERKKNIAQNVKALLVSKIGGTLTVSFDTMVISSFLGLSILGKYNNYMYIMSSVIGFTHILFDAMGAGWGNSIKTETIEKNWELFKETSFINNWLIGWCAACFLGLYQPFITLWIGDDFLLPMIDVILICVYFWVWRYQDVLFTCKEAAGQWRADQFRPLVVGIANLALNIILVKMIGLSGVLLSSIITWILIGFPWLVTNIFRSIFKRSALTYILNALWNALFAAGNACVTWFLCWKIQRKNLFVFFVQILICLIVPNVMFMLENRRQPEFHAFIERVQGILKKRTL